MKNKIMIFIASLSIILVFLMYTREDTIADLKLEIEGTGVEAPESFTFIEGLGLSFLTSGLGYNFGVNDATVEAGFQQLMQLDFSNETDVVSVDEALSKDSVSEQAELDYSTIYEKKSGETIDSSTGKIIDKKDITVTYTTPVEFNSNTLKNTSNAWILNYRFYDDGLTGLKPSYWYSQLFEEEVVFNRAWNSLRWFCQDYLNCEIVSVKNNSIEAIFYGEDIYWYLYLDKLESYDILNDGNKVNTIAMKVDPIKEADAVSILNDLGLINDTSSVE